MSGSRIMRLEGVVATSSGDSLRGFGAAGGVVAAGVTEDLAEADAEPGIVENTTEGRFEADEGWGG